MSESETQALTVDDAANELSLTLDLFGGDPGGAIDHYQSIIDAVILGAGEGSARLRKQDQPLTEIEKQAGDGDLEKFVDRTVPGVNPSYQGRSKQITDAARYSVDDTEWPPIDVRVFATAPERSTRLMRCIHTYARNTVGFGWEIKPVEPFNNDTTDEEKKAAQAEIDLISPVFKRPNSKDRTFTRLMLKVKLDVEATGNGYVEIVRNQDTRLDPLGTIIEMYRVASINCRVLRGGVGFVQMQGFDQWGYIDQQGVSYSRDKRIYFKNFGDPRVMHKKTGKFHTQFDPTDPDGRRTIPAQDMGPVPVEDRANEILQFMIPCLRNDYYGVPRYVASSAAIAGNWLLAGRSVNFFNNDGVPRMIIAVTGGTLAADSCQMIRDTLTLSAKGPKNAGRVVVLQLEPKRSGVMGDQAKPGIDIKPLLVGVNEEMSFGGYRQKNDEEIREAFNIGKAFFTTDDVNRANASATRKITNEQEFEPDRLDMEDYINGTVVEAFHPRFVEFKFKRIPMVDEDERANIDTRYGSSGAMTPNEMRQRMSMPPFPRNYTFADKPFNLALMEMQVGIKDAIEYEGSPSEEELASLAPSEETPVGGIGPNQSPYLPSNRVGPSPAPVAQRRTQTGQPPPPPPY